MPDPTEFSTDPDENGTIGGSNVAEGCPPGGINNAIRYVAAAVRVAYNGIPAIDTVMPLAGGTFTGDISREGQGAYLHHANGAQTDGSVYVLPEGSARPAAAEGRIVLYYAT